MTPIATGARVMYAAKFLRSIGVCTGELPFMQGEVCALQQLGKGCPGLALVRWDDGGASRVLVCNLINANERPLEPA